MQSKPLPRTEGNLFDIIVCNLLSQRDMTSVWCGENGWVVSPPSSTASTSILGWSSSLRCRAQDFSPSMTTAWTPACPHGDVSKHEVTFSLRHDNATQFPSHHFREVAETLGIKLSRIAYRHPDGNAFIERVFKTWKEEAVWPHDILIFEAARVGLIRWLIDDNDERLESSLFDLAPAEARVEALSNHKSAA